MLDLREAKDGLEIEQTFATATRERAEAIVPLSPTVYAAEKKTIVALAAKHRLPAIYEHVRA